MQAKMSLCGLCEPADSVTSDPISVIPECHYWQSVSKNDEAPEILKNSRAFSFNFGSPHWKHSELFFKKKDLIPALQRLLTEQFHAGKYSWSVRS